jgi:hypothetical protein
LRGAIYRIGLDVSEILPVSEAENQSDHTTHCGGPNRCVDMFVLTESAFGFGLLNEAFCFETNCYDVQMSSFRKI